MHTKTRVTVYDCRCERCAHEWRSERLPEKCPRCRARSWDEEVPRKAGRPRQRKP